MKVLIFGGGGFIGSAIIDRLLIDCHEITVFERPQVQAYRTFMPGERVRWIAGDLQSNHHINEAMKGVDAVIHLVSSTQPKNSNDDAIYDVQSNLIYSLKILDAMVQQRIPKILFSSSGGTVYGSANYLPIDEKHQTEPNVSYGVVKLAIEKYLHIYNRVHGIQSLSLRISNPYGERQRVETAQGAVAVFLRKALLDEPIEIWGDGSVVRDFIYIGDVAEAFAKALKYHGPISILNVSSCVGTSINELLAMIEDVLVCKVRRKYLIGRPFDVPVSVLDNSLVMKELDWYAKTNLSEGLSRTAAWIKKNLDKKDLVR